MSGLPLVNYSSAGKSLWMRNQGQILNISSINASTITTDTLAVFPNANSAVSIQSSGATGVQILQTTTDGAADNQIVLDTADKTLQIAMPGNQNGAYINYNFQTRDIGTIGFLPGSGPGMGAINLVDEQNDFLFLGQGNLQFNTTSGGAFSSSNIIASNVTAKALLNVSSINGASYPPVVYPQFIPVTFNSNFTPGNTGYVVPTSNTSIATFPTTVGATYRVTMNPTFNNTSAPGAGDFLSIYGTGNLGPNDTIDFVTLNLNWCGTGVAQGLAGAYGQAVSGIMTATNSNYEILGGLSAGTTVSTLVLFGNNNAIVVEKLS